MDGINAKLLSTIQDGIPLRADCWECLGKPLGISGQQVTDRITELRNDGIIRSKGEVSKGYHSSYRRLELEGH